MKDLTKRFLASIKLNEFDEFDIDMQKMQHDPSSGRYIFIIEKYSPWQFNYLNIFSDALCNITTYKYSLVFTYPNKITMDDALELIDSFIFNNSKYSNIEPLELEKNEVSKTIIVKHPIGALNKEEFEDEVNSLLRFICYEFTVEAVPIREEIKADEEKMSAILEQNVKNETESAKSAMDNFKEAKAQEIMEDINSKSFIKGNYLDIRIGEIDSNSGSVCFKGEVFETKISDSKSGGHIARVGVFDRKTLDAIYVTFISNEKNLKDDDITGTFKEPGAYIEVKGRVSIDKFRKDVVVMGHYFQVCEKQLREDPSYEKRVELHLHSKMSEIDGVSTVLEYCKLAKNMGHTALAVTDHGVVQAFPEAQQAAKKTGIKIIYGSELYMIEDYFKGCLNPQDINLDDATIVCFDLESTGLSIKYDRITEFGAVKIKNGMVVDRIDILMNPEIEIPKFIEEKTHITNEMVKNEPTVSEALPKILDFIKDTVVITHNISFDYWMLNEAMKRAGLGKLTLPAIDTLAISRFIYPENKGHSLGRLCKRLEVFYDEESAHRADYDAEVLSKCWLNLKPLILNKIPEYNHKNLAKLPIVLENLKDYRRFAMHVTALCKNAAGLKDLYKIISISHTEHMGDVPYIMRSELQSLRSNLILGSACFNGDVFYSSTNRNTEALDKAVSFYDFIEIQPLENYRYLLEMNEIRSPELLKRYIMDIVESADRNGKPVVATGDCHYCNPEDKIFRDVMIANPGVGKTPHPLNPYSRKGKHFENPDQHYRSTVEMLEAFDWFGKEKAKEYVITNSNMIADMCEEIAPIPPGTFPPSIDNCENLLKDLCYKNLYERYGNCDDPNDPAKQFIKQRLDTELKGIIENKFSVIYYIAHILVKKSNDAGYLVGSRGSVGSSFAATMADITEVNPLPPHYRCPKCKKVIFYEGNDLKSGFDLPDLNCPDCGTLMDANGTNIPFQTFLGFKAEKVPDIDLNFPTDFQAEAHLFTKELLGPNNVFRAGTISTLQFKTAYGFVRKYYEDLGIDPNKVKNTKIACIAYGCTEVKRTTGQHPGGIVVIPRDKEVYDFTPVQYPAGDVDAAWKTTHFDFHAIHDTVLKLDMLGHVDPQALKMLSDLTGVDCRTLPFNDKKIISLFTTDDALNLQHKYMKKDNGAIGLPEFGTNFVRQMLRETQPKTFSDLLIISGLSHGTNVWANNQQLVIKEGITNLRGLIGCRDDIMDYLISLGIDGSSAFLIMETVRKGKKLKQEQIDLMVSHGVPDYYINSCKKIQYLFPKGHACAYVMMALRVAYYKVYYPLEYYAVYFTLRCDQYDIDSMIKGIDSVHDRLEEFKERRSSNNPEKALSNKEEGIESTLESALEMLERGFSFSNIDLEKSDATNFIVDYEHKSLIPPFKVLDGFGEKGAISLVNARKERPFESKKDLLERGKITKTNLKQLEELGVVNNLSEDDEISLFSFSF